jgi:hypothetical protein
VVRLLVEFGPDRDCCGVLTLFDEIGTRICGPFPVAGRSSDAVAVAGKNPTRNPLLRYGDTPTGGYMLRRLLKSGRHTPFPTNEFGPYGIAVIEGIAGDAACAEANGRFHFLITGGRLSRRGQLRSTSGGLRLKNEHVRILLSNLRQGAEIACDIRERRQTPSRGSVFADVSCDYPDPYPLLGGARASRSREVLRAGAMAFGLSVSFVALDSRLALASAELSLEHPTAASEQDRFLLPVAETKPAYAHMAYNVGKSQKSTNFDIDGFVDYMDKHAGEKSNRECAHACGEGLKAVGIDPKGTIGEAKDYGPFLQRHGAEVVPEKDYKPQKGDIAVFEGNKDHQHGHVQVFDGKQWVSDFKQRDYSPYHDKKSTPPSKIYRFKQYLGN